MTNKKLEYINDVIADYYDEIKQNNSTIILCNNGVLAIDVIGLKIGDTYINFNDKDKLINTYKIIHKCCDNRNNKILIAQPMEEIVFPTVAETK